jgi:phage terminase small subunit
MEKRELRTEITQDKVLNELAKIGFANIEDYVEVDEDQYDDKVVKIKSSKDIPEDKKAAISSIKQGANGIEVKLHDKVRALENIGRHLGMFKDKVEISSSNEIKIQLED